MMKLNIQLFASGTITGSSTASVGRVQIVWSSTASDANTNQSTVVASAQVKRSNAYNTTGTFSGTLWINGVATSIKKKFDPLSNSWKTIGTATVVVPHNDDGSKTVNISTSFSNTGTSMAGTYTASADVALDQIYRNNLLTGITSSFTSTGTFTPTINKRNSGGYDKLVVSYGGTVIKTIYGVVNGTSYSFTSSELNTLYSLYGNASSLTLTFTLTTYSDSGYSAQIASATSLTATCNLPAYNLQWSTASLVDSVSAYDTYKPNSSTFIVGLSQPKFTFGASSTTGSTYGNGIGYYIGSTGISSPYTITSYGGGSYSITATDGRKSITWSPTMTAVYYSAPQITKFEIKRPSATGSIANVSIEIKYYNGTGLTNLRTRALSMNYTEDGGSTTTITSFTTSQTTSNNIITLTATKQLTGLDYKKGISATVYFTDLINKQTSKPTTVPGGQPVWFGYKDSSGNNYMGINGQLLLYDSTNNQYVPIEVEVVDTW